MKQLILLLIFFLTGCGSSTTSYVAGPPGPAGPTGSAGLNGHSAVFKSVACLINGCTTVLMGVDLNDNGTLENAEITASAVVCNGSAGADGANGTDANVSPFLPVIAIQPCGANSSPYKEAMLGLAGGQIFAEFTGSSSTNDVRNTLLPDGSYQDTDASRCSFVVATTATGRTVTWSGGGVEYVASTKTWAVKN